MKTNHQNILLSGSSGLVGTALAKFLQEKGHSVFRLVRRVSVVQNEIFWDPARGLSDPQILEKFDTIIHLSGETIAQRWTKSAKARIAESRLVTTKTLLDAILKCKNHPRNFFCASATGFYGDRPGKILTEDSPRGQGWAAELCEQWENATCLLEGTGVRVVNMRFGIVLSKNGGALAKMLPLFKWGLGSPLGSGNQLMSWIAIDDLAGAVQQCLEHEEISGPVNFTSAQAVTNRGFSQTLAKILCRSLMPAVPAFAVKMIFGQMGTELLLASQNVAPKKLQQSGFQFEFPDLKTVLQGFFK